jgi:hypothetical protein
MPVMIGISKGSSTPWLASVVFVLLAGLSGCGDEIFLPFEVTVTASVK